MKQLLKLTTVGILAGIVLILVLRLVLAITGNTAYVLLFNFDYIPIINTLRPVWLFGYIFHFVTCIISVIALFYILKPKALETKILPYILVYTFGGGALFFLTALSKKPPEANDFMAWLYWTLAHCVFGYTTGILIKKWFKK